jgi:hypothetical protein
MQTMVRVLTSLAVLLPVTVVLADKKTSGDWTYTVGEANEATITEYGGEDVEVSVPAELDGIPVKHIGNMVFFSCGGLREKPFTKITLPEGIETLGSSLCVSADITEITFPASLRSIGPSAFTGTALTKVSIPAGVTNIGDGAFGNCSQLMQIDVDPGNQSYSSIDGVLFDKESKTLVQYPYAKGAEYVIPEGVTTIGAMAFTGGENLTSVIIPKGVTVIGEHAFQDSGLTEVVLPDGLQTIGKSAFLRCSNLTEINVPATVTSIGEGALASGEKIPEISVDPKNAKYSSVDGVLFDKDKKTLCQFPGGRSGTYTVPEGVTAIAAGAFMDTKLSSIVVPASVATIAEGAFKWNKSLTNVVLPEALMGSIDSYGLPEKLASKLMSESAGPAEQLASSSLTLEVASGTYQNVTLKNEYPRSVYIQHDGGTAFIDKSALSDEELSALLGIAD